MQGGGFHHLSVMPGESLAYLDPRPDGTYLDGTLGGGGHSFLIAEKLTNNGRLIALDRDQDALAAAKKRLSTFENRVTYVHANFSEMQQVAENLDIEQLDGILLDLGVSSYQLDTPERGFSFQSDAPLDMRMNRLDELSAKEIVATWSEADLKRIFSEYGEERYSGRIARKIAEQRRESPIETTGQLVDLIRAVVPAAKPDKHPATRVFQALRIAVNSELEHVKKAIDSGVSLLKPGGTMVVISFHSLEDRIVKNSFRALAKNCICPPRMPVCGCSQRAKVKLLTPRGVKASKEEVELNGRSRSAILRAVEKLPEV